MRLHLSRCNNMAQSQLDSVKSMYDERSERYDENQVHVKQAQDYIRWIAPQQGESVLDLATGTGLIALDARKCVDTDGHVVGIDISDGMLNVARRKAQAAGLDVDFYNHDISDLAGIQDRILSSGSAGFDVITCASALILLPDPLRAVQHWKSLLRPGGRLITDVQTKQANLVMNIFSAIAPELGESVPWHSELWQSQQALEKLMLDAGFTVDKVFETDPYAKTKYNLADAPNLFEKAADQSMFRNFGRPPIREKAKELFVKRFKAFAGQSDIIEEETKYWIVVAARPA
jgi:ubiquinone/menaquinone biosynthesis C-methylase UbiE